MDAFAYDNTGHQRLRQKRSNLPRRCIFNFVWAQDGERIAMVAAYNRFNLFSWDIRASSHKVYYYR